MAGKPAASAFCCRGIVTIIVTATTPSDANAATIAIIAIDVVVFSSRSGSYFYLAIYERPISS